jgi:hypothetical protein
VARIGEKGSVFRVLEWISEGKGHFQDIGVNGKLTLKWILNQQD